MIHLIDFDGDRCLLFVEKENGIRSLLLSQKTEESQSMLKKAVQVLLRLLRQIHLEKFLVMVDAEIGLDFLFKPECPILTGINQDMYNNMETYLNSQQLKLNKISYYELVEEEL